MSSWITVYLTEMSEVRLIRSRKESKDLMNLSGFTKNYSALIVGTNIGGLGTLIASMASLISFKYIAKEKTTLRGKYFMMFTIANIVFLILLLLCINLL